MVRRKNSEIINAFLEGFWVHGVNPLQRSKTSSPKKTPPKKKTPDILGMALSYIW